MVKSSHGKGELWLTLRIQLIGVVPVIYRDFRVSSRITLAAFHDQVLCPILGHRRNFHAHAFRRGAPALASILITVTQVKSRGWGLLTAHRSTWFTCHCSSQLSVMSQNEIKLVKELI